MNFMVFIGGVKEKIVEYLQDARILRRERYCQLCQCDYTMVKNKMSIVSYMLCYPGFIFFLFGVEIKHTFLYYCVSTIITTL